ncbi:MAG: DUF6089 family protein, partial [Bacteroidota bacterium]
IFENRNLNNMNKPFITIFFTLLFFPFFSFSQYYEAGATVGMAGYNGDLSPVKRTNIGELNPMVGVFGKYNFNKFLSLRLGGNFAQVSADDAEAGDEGRANRNLSFKSRIIEGSLILEFNILGYQPYNLERPWSPYVFAGVSVFNFNPRAELDGEWYDLQPLGTEGQGLSSFPDREKYSLTEFAIPMGGGIKYAVNDLWNIGIEAGLRITFTDYLDDVSTTYVDDVLLVENSEIAAALANRSGSPVSTGQARGNPLSDDLYGFIGVFISRNFLDNGLVGSRKRSRRSKNGCPTF